MGEQKDGIFAPTNPKRPVRLGVRTSDFHSGNRGSIPLRATKKTSATAEVFCLCHVWSCYFSVFFP